jgi:hypothetical protein
VKGLMEENTHSFSIYTIGVLVSDSLFYTFNSPLLHTLLTAAISVSDWSIQYSLSVSRCSPSGGCYLPFYQPYWWCLVYLFVPSRFAYLSCLDLSVLTRLL